MTQNTALRRLPDQTLPRGGDGIPVPLRPAGRQGTVLMLMHSSSCDGCLEYLHRLGAAREGIEDWDGRIVVVVPGEIADAGRVREALEPSFLVVADPEGRCRERCGLGGGAMVIADQWGEVFHVYPGEEEAHDLPGADEVVEWLRFMAIQCPECQGEAL